MFRGRYQKGCFSVLYSLGSRPLELWAATTKNGYIKRVLDDDCNSVVMEIMGTNVSTCFIRAPKDPNQQLGIKMPFLVLLIKNMHKYFTFEIKIVDDQHFCRRFRVSNFQSKTSVKPFCTQMPMGMSEGWNQVHFNLADFTRRAYGTNYLETVAIQIHANIRVRRVYFTDRLYSEDELPNEYRLIARPKEKKVKDYKVPSARPPSPQSVKAGKSEKSKMAESEGEGDMGGDLDSPLAMPEPSVYEAEGGGDAGPAEGPPPTPPAADGGGEPAGSEPAAAPAEGEEV